MQVHTIILAAASEVFNCIFLNHEKSYHLNFVNSETLQKIISFCYTGQVELSPQNIGNVANAAHELQIVPLKKACNQFLESTVSAENCLQYALIAENCELRSSKEMVQKVLAHYCSIICKMKDMPQKNAVQIVENLCRNGSKIFENVMNSLELFNDGRDSLLLDTYQAIYQSFVRIFFYIFLRIIFVGFSNKNLQYIAGYIQSLVNTKNLSIQEKQLAKEKPIYNRQNTFEINKNQTIIEHESTFDEGLFIITKSKTDGAEILAISEHNRLLRILPKYHINTDKINLDTVKIFPIRDRICFTYIKEQRLIVKSWNFKRQTLIDVTLPAKVQYLKPRLTNAVGESFFVLEERCLNWPHENYKTTVCKFVLESENCKSIELNYGGIKEMIGIGNEIYVINQKAEVFSFNLPGGKRVSRGTLNHNGILRAVVFHGNIYVGCYVRNKCTLFVEHYKKKTNQWTTVKESMISLIQCKKNHKFSFLLDWVHLHIFRCSMLSYWRY